MKVNFIYIICVNFSQTTAHSTNITVNIDIRDVYITNTDL